jgi:hypothetical protein
VTRRITSAITARSAARIHPMEWVFLAVGGVLFSFIVGGYFAGRGH